MDVEFMCEEFNSTHEMKLFAQVMFLLAHTY